MKAKLVGVAIALSIGMVVPGHSQIDPGTASQVVAAVGSAIGELGKMSEKRAEEAHWAEVNQKLDVLLQDQEAIRFTLGQIQGALAEVPQRADIQSRVVNILAAKNTFAQSFGPETRHINKEAAEALILSLQQDTNALISYGYTTYPSVYAAATIWRLLARKLGRTDKDIGGVLRSFADQMAKWTTVMPSTYAAQAWPKVLPTFPSVLKAQDETYQNLVKSCAALPRQGVVRVRTDQFTRMIPHNEPDAWTTTVVGFVVVAAVTGDPSHPENGFSRGADSGEILYSHCSSNGSCSEPAGLSGPAGPLPPNPPINLPRVESLLASYQNIADQAKTNRANNEATKTMFTDVRRAIDQLRAGVPTGL